MMKTTQISLTSSISRESAGEVALFGRIREN